MGFYYNETKTAKQKVPPKVRLQDIPVQAMAEMGCKVCPVEKSTPEDVAKLQPVGGGRQVDAYLLFAAPTMTDGFADPDSPRSVKDKAVAAVLEKLPRGAGRRTRLGGVTQCGSQTADVNQAAIACCQNRVVADIEASKPFVVIGVGDAPLAWATGFPAHAPTWRGAYVSIKVGRHECLYYGVNYPNWAFRDAMRGRGKSEHEMTLEHDLRQVFQDIDAGLDLVEYHTGDYDKGIEKITGNEPGDMQRLERGLADLAGVSRGAVDIETSGLRPWAVDPLVICAAVGTFEHTLAFSIDHPSGWGSETQRRKVWQLFGEYILHSGTKEAHNLSFEMEWLSFFYGDRVLRCTGWDDTMSMAHTLDGRPGTKSLDAQCRMLFGFFLKSQSNVDVKRPKWWLQYDLKDILRYNGLDTKWTNLVSRRLRPLLAGDHRLQYQHDRKVRLASTLVLTEARGLPVDMGFAVDMERKLQGQIEVLNISIANCSEVKEYTRRFGVFSPTTPDHVLKLMRDVCDRDEVHRAVKGSKIAKMTSDEEALSSIPAHEVPSAPLILEHRGLEKIQSTYIRPLTSRKIVSADGKIHSKYSSMTAVTNRLAGEDPNPQNWPKRKHKGVRGVVAAGEGRWIVAADYGQIEFRVAGMISEDENLVKACWTNYDVHMFWAKRIVSKYPAVKDWIVAEFEVDWDDKGMKTLRQEVKNKWVFPSIFGAVVASRAANLHLPFDIAQDLDAEFWDTFRGVKKWQQRALKFYEKNNYIETLGGFRRRGAMSPNEIINMPIQGTAAEVVTEGMMALSEIALVEDLPDLQPILNVHDDLTFDPEDRNLESTIARIAREMCMHRFDYINVPLVVEISIGRRWSELEELGVYRSDEIFKLPNPFN